MFPKTLMSTWNGECRGMVPAPPNIPVAPLLKRQLMEL
jgi:hypothetical protein